MGLISIVPDLKDGEGHMLEYHENIGRALMLLGQPHDVLYHSKRLAVSRKGWIKCLRTGSLDQSISTYANVTGVFRFLFDCLLFPISILKNLNVCDRSSSLFVERFNVPQLLLLAFIALFIRDRGLWVLFRHDQNHYGKKLIFYKLAVRFLSLIKGKGLYILVDSDLLKADLEQVFGETIHVLPVPVKKAANIGEVRGRDTLNMWWPGSPRPEKGWKNIKKLVSELASYHQGVFSLTVSSKTVEVVSPNLRTVNNVLTRQEYLSQFQNSELILLPYDSRKYRASTSGIFVEAVIYGKIPLVSEGTWMAYELKKFDLLDLVIDWEGEQLLKVFLGVAKSKRVREKLKLMQSHYEQFHSVENLSKTISRLQKNQDD